MTKKILISLLFLITCITISAQSNAITASEDTTINVIAWFNKNDTTEYTYKKQVMVINDDDTTRTNSLEHDFRVNVVDSTSNGYRLQYQTLSWKADNEQDSLRYGFQMAIGGDKPLVFTTNGYGQIEHLENWREVRNESMPGIMTFFDVIYAKHPGLDSIMPKRNLINLIKLGMNSEDEVKDLFPSMISLFSLHGRSFTIGLTHNDAPANGCGYPVESTTIVSYEKADTADTESHNGDYVIRNNATMTMSGSDTKELASTMAGVFLSEDTANKLDSIIGDSLNVPLKIRVLTDYHYFYSGWPKQIRKQTIVKLGDIMTKVTTENIEWNRYRWNEYDNDNDDGDAKSL